MNSLQGGESDWIGSELGLPDTKNIARDQPPERPKRTALQIVEAADFDDQAVRDEFVAALHRECAVLKGAGSVRYVHFQAVDDVMPVGRRQMRIKRNTISRYTRPDFVSAWEPAAYYAVPEGSNKPVRRQLANDWLRSTDRRVYHSEKFVPGYDAPPGILNLWTGWGVEPRPGDWAILREHILDNLCQEDEDLFEFVMDWLADMFQNPARKPGTALVFRGLKGTGKSKLAEWLTYLCGQHGLICDKPEQITGRFNGHLADKLLVVADEATCESRSTVGALNVLITSQTLPCERKGVDIVDIPSHHRLIVIGNAEWNVPATPDERRYCVLDVGDFRRKDRRYFAALDEQMANGGAEAMLHDLMHRKITHDVGAAPMTAGLGHQIAAGLKPIWRFLVRAADEGAIKLGFGAFHQPLNENGYTALCKASVMEWIEQELYYGRLPPREVGEAFKAAGITTRKASRGDRHPSQSQASSIKGNRLLEFPPRAELQKNIEAALGYSLDILTGGC